MPAKKTARKTAAKKTTKRKATARKAPARKVAKRKPAAKKRVAKKAVSRVAAKKVAAVKTVKEKMTSSTLYNLLSERTDLPRKQVKAVFDELANVMEASLKKGSVSEFTLPGLMKVVVKKKPATKARKGINPFTGEEIMIKAKPARRAVKVRPLKKVKEMAG